ncbi:MAG: formate dehydrogenase subunit gamma [Burkholderiales bacterium]|nr:formate dehydrogenase subunit gamma [Burkholderiales bacterium]
MFRRAPAFYVFSSLFGGGPWTRILHPFIAVAMFVFFFVTMTQFWRFNRITAADRQWMQRLPDVVMNRDDGLPEVGKYNAGQKYYFFWVTVVCAWLLLVSGVIMWRPYFAEGFPIGLNRIAVVVHALSAFVFILGIIVHVYAAIWVKGSLRAMTRGSVSSGGARQHHRGWYREVTGK